MDVAGLEQSALVPCCVVALFASEKQKHVWKGIRCFANVANLLLSAGTQMGTRCPGATH